MNHLDVGYNGISPEIGFVYNVINKYETKYLKILFIFFSNAILVTYS